MERKYEAKLLENKLSFETALVVKAKDADLQGTKNSDIVYEIIDGDYKRNFSIDAKHGVITVVHAIDYEKIRIHDNSTNIQSLSLTVMARDLGTPSLSSRVQVIIYLHDVNDNRPDFHQKYYAAAIPENAQAGSFVMKV